MTTGVQTPFGIAPTVATADSATAPVAMMTTTGGTGTGTAQVSPMGLTTIAAAPTHDPSLVLGRATTVFCTGDSKIYQNTTGTTWIKTAALS